MRKVLEIKISGKKYKQARHCYMCGSDVFKAVIILSALHGFVLCAGCAHELRDALEDFYQHDESED
jgi:hypothetical protein